MTDYLNPRIVAWRRWTDGPLFVQAIGSLPLLLLEVSRDDLPYSDRLLLDIVNIAVLVAFAIDYVVELVLASQRRRYVRSEWTSLLIVGAQAVALIPGFVAASSLRALRAGRAWRVIAVVGRLAAIGGASAREGRQLLRKHAAGFALGFSGFTLLCSAVGFTLAEDVGEGGRIHSFFDSIWWASSTMTSVGYGDIYPVTVAGRLIGITTMLVGISAFAVITAKVAEFLVRVGREDAAADPSLTAVEEST
jgi:voltage-gated potassium channel